MRCIRCDKRFDSYIPEKNAESYGGPVYYACPYCGKLYQFDRVVIYNLVEDFEYASCKKEDDWGNSVIRDKDYKVKGE